MCGQERELPGGIDGENSLPVRRQSWESDWTGLFDVPVRNGSASSASVRQLRKVRGVHNHVPGYQCRYTVSLSLVDRRKDL